MHASIYGLKTAERAASCGAGEFCLKNFPNLFICFHMCHSFQNCHMVFSPPLLSTISLKVRPAATFADFYIVVADLFVVVFMSVRTSSGLHNDVRLSACSYFITCVLILWPERWKGTVTAQ
jgi:hypothetical protein